MVAWRELPESGSWQVTPKTARLLQHWRSHRFGDIRPFFWQVEAMETVIGLTEVAPQRGREERDDPDSYYASRELVPNDRRRDLERRSSSPTTTRSCGARRCRCRRVAAPCCRGAGPELRTKETEGQMLQRVMPGLMGVKRILALNDEAHHCYREKPAEEGEEGSLKGDDRKEAERNREAARVCVAGLEAVQRRLGLQRGIDLSATPFFLRGSGYREGVLFPWTASDSSLMDAIESGIVKLPRVPVADNIPGGEMPKFRSSTPAKRSTRTSAPPRATRSRDSAGSESNGPVTARRPSISPTRICSAR